MKDKVKAKLMKALNVKNGASWYRMEVRNDISDIYIYDEISWYAISADQFVKDLGDIKSKTIRVHLNTPGGNVFDGVAIYNALKQHEATIETYIDGLAASIGSMIALAGDTVRMADNGFFMIHEPWILAIGDSEELRKTADVLDKISGTLVKTYVKKSGKDEDQIKEWLAAETWFTAEEAKDAGFIDEIIVEEPEAKAEYDLGVFANVPAALLVQNKKQPETIVPKFGSMEMELELAEKQ